MHKATFVSWSNTTWDDPKITSYLGARHTIVDVASVEFLRLEVRSLWNQFVCLSFRSKAETQPYKILLVPSSNGFLSQQLEKE